MNGFVVCGRCEVPWSEHHDVEMRNSLLIVPLCEDEYQLWLQGRDPFEHLKQERRETDDEATGVWDEGSVRDEGEGAELSDATDEETWGNQE